MFSILRIMCQVEIPVKPSTRCAISGLVSRLAAFDAGIFAWNRSPGESPFLNDPLTFTEP